MGGGRRPILSRLRSDSLQKARWVETEKKFNITEPEGKDDIFTTDMFMLVDLLVKTTRRMMAISMKRN